MGYVVCLLVGAAVGVWFGTTRLGVWYSLYRLGQAENRERRKRIKG